MHIQVWALELDDFVPSFLSAAHKTESATADPALAFSLPEASKKRNSSSSGSWYCDRVSGIVCTKQNASRVIAQTVSGDNSIIANANQGANDQYFNRNKSNFNQNATNNFNITNSNQSALQIYAPQLNYSAEQQIKNNMAVPIQADKNTSVSVGQQQIEFNIKY